ncbi:unnamed protein product [Ambrosiozyma monospora]|uniref:Unnamed protein product n=1 Tax=Ambrosiozyma monospora TaxID=43982 RepID=A0ACB5SWE5_AMBMO|nr:unnamed protein product [Ambrosiozyma monospora]
MINKSESFSPVRQLSESPLFLNSKANNKSKSPSISPSRIPQLKNKHTTKKNDNMKERLPTSKDSVRSTSAKSPSSQSDHSTKPSSPFQRLAQRLSQAQKPPTGREWLVNKQKSHSPHLLKVRQQVPAPVPAPRQDSSRSGEKINRPRQQEVPIPSQNSQQLEYQRLQQKRQQPAHPQQQQQQQQQQKEQQQQQQQQQLPLERLSTYRPPETPIRERLLKFKLNRTLSTTQDLIIEWTKDFDHHQTTSNITNNNPQHHNTISLPAAMALLNKHYPQQYQRNLHAFIKRLNVIRVLELLKTQFCQGDLTKATQLLDAYIAANRFTLDWWSKGLTMAEEPYENVDFNSWYKYYYGDLEAFAEDGTDGEDVHELLGFKMVTHYSDLALSCRIALCEAIVNVALEG